MVLVKWDEKFVDKGERDPLECESRDNKVIFFLTGDRGMVSL